MGEALTALLQEHVVASLLKQERFHEAIGEITRYDADLESRRLRLGRRTYGVDIVGTESIPAGTFVWGWANPSIPDHDAADAVRRVGEERGIPELLDDGELPAETLNAGTASMIAAGVADLDGYYLAVHEGERAVSFAIRDDEIRGRPVPLVHFASSFMEVASVAAFSHRRAFAHYLAKPLPDVPATTERGRAVLRGADATVSVAFDPEGRVADFRFEAPS